MPWNDDQGPREVKVHSQFEIFEPYHISYKEKVADMNYFLYGWQYYLNM